MIVVTIMDVDKVLLLVDFGTVYCTVQYFFGFNSRMRTLGIKFYVDYYRKH